MPECCRYGGAPKPIDAVHEHFWQQNLRVGDLNCGMTKIWTSRWQQPPQLLSLHARICGLTSMHTCDGMSIKIVQEVVFQFHGDVSRLFGNLDKTSPTINTLLRFWCVHSCEYLLHLEDTANETWQCKWFRSRNSANTEVPFFTDSIWRWIRLTMHLCWVNHQSQSQEIYTRYGLF
jgi:hypothetical protein